MSNYTRPNNSEHQDDPKEWLNSALIFARSISLLMMENTGVVVDLKGQMYDPIGESKKVIIIKKDGQIAIDTFEQDLPEGTVCIVKPEEDEEELEDEYETDEYDAEDE